jgi:hypothetical protein
MAAILLTGLPYDVLITIVRHLDDTSLLVCRYVCRRVSRAAGRCLPLHPRPPGGMYDYLNSLPSALAERICARRLMSTALVDAAGAGHYSVVGFLASKAGRSDGRALLEQIQELLRRQACHEVICASIVGGCVEMSTTLLLELRYLAGRDPRRNNSYRQLFRRQIRLYVGLANVHRRTTILSLVVRWLLDTDEGVAAYQPSRPREVVQTLASTAIREGDEALLSTLKEAGWLASRRNAKERKRRGKDTYR